MRLPTLISILTLLLPGALAAQEREGDAVPFELKTGIIFVQGTINGEGPLTFLFDTGASMTVVKPATAEKLGLVEKGAGKNPFGGLFGVGMKTVRLRSIGIGKAVVQDLPVVSMGVPQADIPLKLQGIHYDGILGYNFISQFVTTIDYTKSELRLVPCDYRPVDVLSQGMKPGARYGGRTSKAKGSLGFSYAAHEETLVVKLVAKGGPAEKAGLRSGDVLLEMDGKRIGTTEEYREKLGTIRPGDRVKLTVVRNGNDLILEVVAGKRPS